MRAHAQACVWAGGAKGGGERREGGGGYPVRAGAGPEQSGELLHAQSETTRLKLQLEDAELATAETEQT